MFLLVGKVLEDHSAAQGASREWGLYILAVVGTLSFRYRAARRPMGTPGKSTAKDSLTASQLPDRATRPLSIVLNVLVQARFYLATWYDEN